MEFMFLSLFNCSVRGWKTRYSQNATALVRSANKNRTGFKQSKMNSVIPLTGNLTCHVLSCINPVKTLTVKNEGNPTADVIRTLLIETWHLMFHTDSIYITVSGCIWLGFTFSFRRWCRLTLLVYVPSVMYPERQWSEFPQGGTRGHWKR